MKKRTFETLGLASLLIGASFVAGCATSNLSSQATATGSQDPVAQVIRVYKEDDSAPTNPTMKPLRVLSVVNDEVRGRKLKNNKFDIPVVVNPAVEKWVDYFTGKGRIHFEKYLARSRYFIPVISKVLNNNNMPQDLVYLAMIESGFNNIARSHASAVGPWQFIRSTGRIFGLNINYWIDERRDTQKSTLAAISYLRRLYEEFGSWEVAAASYNAGEMKLRKAIRKYKSNNFWEVAKHRYLRPETRNYVPKIMAAAIIAKNPELFGFEDPFTHVPNPTLLDPSEISPKELGDEQNTVASADSKEEKEEAEDEVAVADAEEEEDEESFATHLEGEEDHMAAASSVYMVQNPNEQIVVFEVKGPADLFAIARAAGVPFSAVKMLNPELSRWCTPPSMKTYKIKLPLSAKDQFLASYNDTQFDRKVVFTKYKVKASDSIPKIARKFSTQPEAIRELNKLGEKENYARVGTDLQLPIPMGYKRVIAALYDEKPAPARKRRYRRRFARRTTSLRRISHAASGVRKTRIPSSTSAKR